MQKNGSEGGKNSSTTVRISLDNEIYIKKSLKREPDAQTKIDVNHLNRSRGKENAGFFFR